MPFPAIAKVQIRSRGATQVQDLDIAKVVVPAPPRAVRMIERGIQGPPGSGSAIRHTHVQNPAAAMWTVPHNLGKYPQVDILSVGGEVIGGKVVHSTVNLLYIYFAAPFAGSAICDVNT